MEKFQGSWGGSWEFDPSDQLGTPGGFAIVHPGLASNGTPVAVKVIDPKGFGANPPPLELLKREFEIAEKLRDHSFDRLIRVFDIAERNGCLLLVMEKAERSLASEIPAGGLDERHALAIMREISEALAELHGVPVLHRDLKL